MTLQEIRETSSILIIAGSEATGTCLAGTIYYLLKNPRVLEKAKMEVREVFSSDKEINFTSINQLPYLWAVIDESLRIYPPAAGAFARVTPSEGAVIDGLPIPSNVILLQLKAIRLQFG